MELREKKDELKELKAKLEKLDNDTIEKLNFGTTLLLAMQGSKPQEEKPEKAI